MWSYVYEMFLFAQNATEEEKDEQVARLLRKFPALDSSDSLSKYYEVPTCNVCDQRRSRDFLCGIEAWTT